MRIPKVLLQSASDKHVVSTIVEPLYFDGDVDRFETMVFGVDADGQCDFMDVACRRTFDKKEAMDNHLALCKEFGVHPEHPRK